MISKNVFSILALSAVVSAIPAIRRQDDPCQVAYRACVATGTPDVACLCRLQECAGEDNARGREYCLSATASLSLPATTATATATATSAPVAAPATTTESCTPLPTSTKAAEPVTTSIPGGCNPAHPGSCPTPSTTKAAEPVTTSIPGGCNPAHPGSCPTPSAAVPSSAAGSNPTKVPNKTWTINSLSRYCGDGNTGCDYNFSIDINGKREQCTIIRMPGSNAATESWFNQPCTTGSQTFISWGYAASPAPAYAVVTINNGKEIAWTGVSDVNGQKVTPSNPFGSGQFTVAPAQVFTY